MLWVLRVFRTGMWTSQKPGEAIVLHLKGSVNIYTRDFNRSAAATDFSASIPRRTGYNTPHKSLPFPSWKLDSIMLSLFNSGFLLHSAQTP